MSWDVQNIGMGTGNDHSFWICGFPQKYIPRKLSMPKKRGLSLAFQPWGQES
jgi:hypothetical protein